MPLVLLSLPASARCAHVASHVQMATLVLEQDEAVRTVETQAVQVNTDVEQGSVQSLSCCRDPRVLYAMLTTASHRPIMPDLLIPCSLTIRTSCAFPPLLAIIQSQADAERRQVGAPRTQDALGLLHHLAHVRRPFCGAFGPLADDLLTSTASSLVSFRPRAICWRNPAQVGLRGN